MHWGTVVLSLEPILEPQKDLEIQPINLDTSQMMLLF